VSTCIAAHAVYIFWHPRYIRVSSSLSLVGHKCSSPRLHISASRSYSKPCKSNIHSHITHVLGLFLILSLNLSLYISGSLTFKFFELKRPHSGLGFRTPASHRRGPVPHVSPREICGGQSGIEVGFSSSTSVSPVSIIPPMLHTHSSIYYRRCITLSTDSSV
jgi:hypothetical protein